MTDKPASHRNTDCADASPQEPPRAKSGGGHILDMVPSARRPAEIEDRAVPGALGGRPSHRSKRHAHRHPRPGATPASTYCSSRSPAGHDDLLLRACCGHGKLLRVSVLLDRDQGKEAWPPTSASRLPPMSRSTSVIRAVPGSVAQTRTPTTRCVSTPQGEEPTSRGITQSYLNAIACSINVRERPGLPNASR